MAASPLASAPEYQPAFWNQTKDGTPGQEPLTAADDDFQGELKFTANCYVYILNWPGADEEDVFDVGDFYAADLKIPGKEDKDTYLVHKTKTSGLDKQAAQVVTQLQECQKAPNNAESIQQYKKSHLGLVQAYTNLVRKFAVRDGLRLIPGNKDTPLEKIMCSGGWYLVALFIDPDPNGLDHHWYRLDNNGLWSHKPGEGRIRNFDADGKKISDPRKGALGDWKVFGGFFAVPAGGQSSLEKTKSLAADSDIEDDSDDDNVDIDVDD
jgi:hypothetical protein